MAPKWLRDLLHRHPSEEGAVRVLVGNGSAITSVGLSGSGRLLLVATMSGGRQFTEVQPIALESDERAAGQETIPVVASPVRQWYGGAVELWALDRGERLHVFEGHRSAVRGVGVDKRGRHAVSVGDDGTLRLWDLKKRECVRTRDGEGEVAAVALSEDGALAVVGGASGRLALWEIGPDRLTPLVDRGLATGGSVECLALSAPARVVVSGGADGVVRVWDVASRMVVHKLYAHGGKVRAVAVSPDGGWAASGGQDGTVTVWDLTAGQRLRDFPGHSGGVTAIALSRDGRTVVSGGQSGKAPVVRVWDVLNAACRLTFRRHRRAISALALTPDDGWVVSGSHDGTLQLWPLPR